MTTQNNIPLKSDDDLVTDALNDVPLAGYTALKRILRDLEANTLEGALRQHVIDSLRRCIDQNQLLDLAFHIQLPALKKRHGNAKSDPFEVACANAILVHYADKGIEEAVSILCEITEEDRTGIQSKRDKYKAMNDWVTIDSASDRIGLNTLLYWSGSLRNKIVEFLPQESLS